MQYAVEAEVFLTERAGHARELARGAVARGASTVVAWGGDGTVNEVGSALTRSTAALAIVPAGSGNGLARELGIPRDSDRAFHVAVQGSERRMDAGELDGRLFFNIAGLGLDARVALRFSETGLASRGFSRYAALTLQELASNEAADYVVEVDGAPTAARATLVAIANAKQYGNGLTIAPRARIDDGRLDVVLIGVRPFVQALWELPRLFMGHIERLSGVTVRTGSAVRISSPSAMLYHVDGEPHRGGPCVEARVHPGVLRVRTPR
jgi:YegS/Rv2252/BmrU family lipid kinase